MHKQFLFFSLLITMSIFISIISCDDAPALARELLDSKQLVFDTMQAAPVLSNPQVSRASFAAGTLASNKPLDNIYVAFKDYDPNNTSTMDQGVDGSNIYVSIHGALQQLEGAAEYGDDPALGTTAVVEPTFGLVEGHGVGYTMGGTQSQDWEGTGYGRFVSWAGNIAGDNIETVIATKIKGDMGGPDNATEAKTSNITYLKHNGASGDVLMDLTYTVEYSTGDTYAPRVWLDGNMNTHTFMIRGGSYGTNASMGAEYYATYEGAGCNAGADEYMLFHTRQLYWNGVGTQSAPEEGGLGISTTTGSGWYKIPAGAGQTELEALTGYDTLENLIAGAGDPKGYADMVTGLDIFAFNELSHTETDFSNQNTLTLP